MTKKTGFTLIELMVVVSIVTLLSSIFFASSASAYRKSRDTKRQQQVHQVDLAIQQYVLENGHAPDLQGTCQAGPDGLDGDLCVAVSNSEDPAQIAAWDNFKKDIEKYMPDIPNDPCGSSCQSASGDPLSYVYVAPAAMQEICVEPCTMSIADLNDSYQIYANLETSSNPSASASFLPLHSSDPGLIPYIADAWLEGGTPNPTEITQIEAEQEVEVSIMGTNFTQDTVVVLGRLGQPEIVVNTSISPTYIGSQNVEYFYPRYAPDTQLYYLTFITPKLTTTEYSLKVRNSNGISNPIRLFIVH